ncbi:WhiB family transcriptional regulator [Dactylosporangium sp. AC04546]|uniref:WhiB family transcriptional regulator n=1 Tax=Dactylosporangium sp. AC04546 TaxID=2862460 RepID=UPI001EDFF972|nr:WhiB family transcriptional regulator [Dactylosporangium sp. AC04546]WVK87801.1 WhiB family transcriptional regulator [Dactylosporangium sp. AC04546]
MRFVCRSSQDGWRDLAACRGLDVTWFYPDPDDRLAVTRAQSFWATCPVRRPCARHAITAGERHGIWGGSTEQERAAFRRATTRRTASPHGGRR